MPIQPKSKKRLKRTVMKKLTLFSIAAILISLSSCQVVEGIFKAGVWVGVIAVVLVIAIIFWLINKAGKK